MIRILVLILMMAWPAFSQQVGNVTANKLRGGTLPSGCNAGPPPDVFVQTGTPPVVYICGPSNTWNALVGGGSGITGSLVSGRVPIASGTTTLTTDADLTFSGSRLTVTDLTVSNSCTGCGTGTVTTTGSPASGQLSIMSGATSITSDSDLTFATDTLTATKIIGSTSITDSGLTAGRVIYAGTAGILSDSADFVFNPASTDYELFINASTAFGYIANFQKHITNPGNNQALNGIEADVAITNVGTGSSMRGALVNASTDGTGSIDTLTGLRVQASVNSATLTRGIYVTSAATGTVGTNIGILVGDITGASTNQAITTGAGDITFGALTSTGAAGSKKVVCVDTGTGKLYASSSDTACAN